MSISFDSTLSEVYSFGRKKVGNPFNGGFVKEDMKQELFKRADYYLFPSSNRRSNEKVKWHIQEIENQEKDYCYNLLADKKV